MERRLIKHIISTVVLIFISSISPLAQTAVVPSAGDGTVANPYQIATLENLYWIVSDTANWKYNYIQTADINASQTSRWFNGQGWQPIGNTAPFFQGNYNGNGHIIDSLFINRPSDGYVGLFGFTTKKVINLGVTSANITGGESVGIIVGMGEILEDCYSTGIVNGTGSYTGGLVGSLGPLGRVVNSFSTAEVNGNYGAGGLVGENNESLILNSYSLGKITGQTSGGLVGFNGSSLIMNCYFAGKVNGSSVGGLIGAGSFTIDTMIYIFNSYWDTDSTSMLTTKGGIGKTTAELKNPLLFVNSPWDSTIWYMDAGFNNGYPYLSWQNPGGTPLPKGNVIPPAVGDGTKANPYQIATLKNLYWLAQNPLLWGGSIYFLQVADINASQTRELGNGEGWIPIGIIGQQFHDTYYGNSHTIDSLFINRPLVDNQGLFGYTGVFSVIDSLGIINADITGLNNVGSFCGNSYSYISNCYSTGKIYGTGSEAGGLVGSLEIGTINNCYSTANVTGGNSVGGLVGNCNSGSTVDHCYSIGVIIGKNNAGGLVGTATNYPRPAVNNSFWDSVSSGQTTSAGGIGKSTSEMKTTKTFSDVGWSPVFWYMDSTFNDGYPYLSWQNPDGTPMPLIAKFGIDNTSMNFGSVPIDSSKKEFTKIFNFGFDTLRITNIISTNKSFTFEPATMKVSPSGKIIFWVTFTPKDSSTQTGYIIITSNTSGSPDSLAVIGKGSRVTAINYGPDIPNSFAISQNYPNPFNPVTVIDYSISKTTLVSIKVYDILGRYVAQLVKEIKHPGKYSVKFDGTSLPSGIYFYSITAGKFNRVRKMILLK